MQISTWLSVASSTSSFYACQLLLSERHAVAVQKYKELPLASRLVLSNIILPTRCVGAYLGPLGCRKSFTTFCDLLCSFINVINNFSLTYLTRTVIFSRVNVYKTAGLNLLSFYSVSQVLVALSAAAFLRHAFRCIYTPRCWLGQHLCKNTRCHRWGRWQLGIQSTFVSVLCKPICSPFSRHDRRLLNVESGDMIVFHL
jgi:hypothetical protein